MALACHVHEPLLAGLCARVAINAQTIHESLVLAPAYTRNLAPSTMTLRAWAKMASAPQGTTPIVELETPVDAPGQVEIEVPVKARAKAKSKAKAAGKPKAKAPAKEKMIKGGAKTQLDASNESPTLGKDMDASSAQCPSELSTTAATDVCPSTPRSTRSTLVDLTSTPAMDMSQVEKELTANFLEPGLGDSGVNGLGNIAAGGALTEKNLHAMAMQRQTHDSDKSQASSEEEGEWKEFIDGGCAFGSKLGVRFSRDPSGGKSSEYKGSRDQKKEFRIQWASAQLKKVVDRRERRTSWKRIDKKRGGLPPLQHHLAQPRWRSRSKRVASSAQLR